MILSDKWDNLWYIRVLHLVGPVATVAFIQIGWWKHYWPLATGLWLACLFVSIVLKRLAYRREVSGQRRRRGAHAAYPPNY